MVSIIGRQDRQDSPDSSNHPPSMTNSVPVTYWFCHLADAYNKPHKTYRDEAEDALGVINRRARSSEGNGPLRAELVIVLLGPRVVFRVDDRHSLMSGPIMTLKDTLRRTEGKYPGQTTLTRTPKFRRANSVASWCESEMVAALEAL